MRKHGVERRQSAELPVVEQSFWHQLMNNLNQIVVNLLKKR